MLNRVVFPEPFGPISPAIPPCSTSIVQSLSACTPPKAFETRSVRNSAVIARSRYPARRTRPGSGAGRLGSAGPRRLAGIDVRRGLPLEGQHLQEAGARLPLEDEGRGLEVLAARLAL